MAKKELALTNKIAEIELAIGNATSNLDETNNNLANEASQRIAGDMVLQNNIDAKALEILPESVTPEKLSAATLQLIETAGGGSITNLPDDEDLTVEGGVLKFKDKAFLLSNFSGLGRRYLRKNIDPVSGKNILSQAMLNDVSTVYIIQYDYDLDGATLAVPTGCTLDFQGGSLNNGTLACLDTKINCLDTSVLNVTTTGTLINKTINVNNLAFGYSHIQAMPIGSLCTLASDVDAPSSIELKASIKGGLHRITSLSGSILLDLKSSYLSIEDVRLLIDNDGGTSFCRSIYSINRSFVYLKNVSVENGSLYFANNQLELVGNIIIDNCDINIDHSLTNQDTYIQHDGIIFRGIKFATIRNSKIEATNVNRIFKMADTLHAQASTADFACEFINVENCHIKGTAVNGKQAFDMYNRTTNVVIDNCKIDATGFNIVFENKTNIAFSKPFNITVKNSEVLFDFQLAYFNMDKDHARIRFINNDFFCSSIENSRTLVENGAAVNLTRTGLIDFRNGSYTLKDNKFDAVSHLVLQLVNVRELLELNIDGNTWDKIQVPLFMSYTINTFVYNNNINKADPVSNEVQCYATIETAILQNNISKAGDFIYANPVATFGILKIRNITGPGVLIREQGGITILDSDGILVKWDFPSTQVPANSVVTVNIPTGSVDHSLYDEYKFVERTPCFVNASGTTGSYLIMSIYNPTAVSQTVSGKVHAYRNRTI